MWADHYWTENRLELNLVLLDNPMDWGWFMLRRIRKLFSFTEQAKKILIPTVLGVLITFGFYMANLAKPTAIEQLGNLLFDRYQRSAPREYDPATSPVRIIDIDNESLKRLGQWPWPRTTIAKLNDRLSAAGAAVIAYDIVFSEEDRTSPEHMVSVFENNPSSGGDFANITELQSHDEILSKSFSKTQVIGGFFLIRSPSDRHPMTGGFAWGGVDPKRYVANYAGAITPIPTLEKSLTGEGFLTIEPGGDGIIRVAPLIARIGDDYFRSLSLEALRAAYQAQSVIVRSSAGTEEFGSPKTDNPEVAFVIVGNSKIPTTNKGELQVYFSKPVPERYIPAWKILSDEIPMNEWSDRVAGQIVFVGTGADGLKDIKATPIRAAEPGVLIHAQVVEQVISGQYLRRPYWAGMLELTTILISGILLSLALPRLGAAKGVILSLVVLNAVFIASWVAFKNHQLLLNPIYPILAVISCYIVITLASFYLTETERSRIRNAFGMYLSPTMVKKVSDDPSQLSLGGEERNMTVLFLDIRGFSKISESMQPSEITTFLNIFLTPMTDILQDNLATIDKYIGDAIVAFWNAPLDDEQHEKNAAHSVMQMQEALEGLNQQYRNQDDVKWPDQVSVGIGLNTGICCVGNLGSKQRFSYSMIGDAANLASRIEGLTKQYKVSALIGNETANALDGHALLEADLIQVVGREAPERIFILVGEEKEAQTDAFQSLTETHTVFLSAYRSREWKKAQGLLPLLKEQSAPLLVDGYYDVMNDRIEHYKKTPPPKDWSGTYVATSK
jgi:adenylate cyclase